MRKAIGEFLISNPLLRTISFVVTTVLTGIFCSALVTEMTIDTGIVDYTKIIECPSFKGLATVIIIYLLYNWLTYSYDADMLKYGDVRRINEYIIKNSLPQAAEQIQDRLKDGSLLMEDWRKLLCQNEDNYRR